MFHRLHTLKMLFKYQKLKTGPDSWDIHRAMWGVVQTSLCGPLNILLK